MTVQVIHGDCLAVLPTLEADSLDACCTDPPYHLASIVKRFGGANAAPAKGNDAYIRASKGFMNREWDGGDIAFRPETWAAVYRVLKPGAHLLAFAGTRNSHRMVCAIEDAGFEIRDSLMWVYASGFPKSHNISKAIDRAAGVERDVVGKRTDGRYAYAGCDITGGNYIGGKSGAVEIGTITAPATDAARQWQGWGSALKPSHEPICFARKPISEGTIAANVLRHGTGAINIDACRIGTTKRVPGSLSHTDGQVYGTYGQETGAESGHDPNIGRWPANIVTDGSEAVLAAFPNSNGAQSAVTGNEPSATFSNTTAGPTSRKAQETRADTGSAARFFFSGKATAEDRAGTTHPTTKPINLLIWLTKLVTPPGGTVLDLFAGSGTTGVACVRNGFNAILIEQDAAYVEMIKSRLRQDFVQGVEPDPGKPQPKHDAQQTLGLF